MRRKQTEIRAEQTRQITQSMKRLVTGLRLLLEAALEAEGVTLAQLRMLHSLQEQADLSAADLARTCFITPQSMQAIVTRAEREKWIVRTPSAANRRILTTRLTAAGRRVLERGTVLSEQMMDEIWAGASVSDLKGLSAMLSSAVLRLQPGLQELHVRSAARRKTL